MKKCELKTVELTDKVNVTVSDLHTIRQYIYNVMCAQDGDVSQEIMLDAIFTEHDILRCVHKGLQHYEQLHTRSLVCDVQQEYCVLNKYDKRYVFVNTHSSELAARIVSLFFQTHEGEYVSTCTINNVKTSMRINAHKLHSVNLTECRRSEYDTYFNLFTECDEHVISLCFLYSLGIQK